MRTRHVATAVLGLTLVLGACDSGSSGSKASTGTPDSSSVTTISTVTSTAPSGGSAGTVRTDDLDAELRSVDREMSGVQQSVNQANDTSPDRADD